MRGIALLQLQSLALGLQENYAMVKEAPREKFVPKERAKLHKAEFYARRHEQDEQLPDLTSSLRRLITWAHLEVVPDLHDSLAKDHVGNVWGWVASQQRSVSSSCTGVLEGRE